MGLAVVNSYEAELLPLSSEFSKIIRIEKLNIIGSFNPEGEAAIEAAYSAASDFDSCAELRTNNVDIQVINLQTLDGASIGAAAFYSFVSLCTFNPEQKSIHICTGYVDHKGGINKINGIKQKALIASRYSIPLILPSENQLEFELLHSTHQVNYLTNVREIEELIRNGNVNNSEIVPTIFNALR